MGFEAVLPRRQRGRVGAGRAEDGVQRARRRGTERRGRRGVDGDVQPGAEGAEDRGKRKTRRGYVVSDKMTKTVVVAVEDRVKHPLYAKAMRRTTKVKAHDENGVAGVGALVAIAETRTRGILHVAGGGECTWWDFAVAAFQRAGLAVTVHRGSTADLGRPAPRPAYSVLGSTRSDAPVLPAWQDGLAAHLTAREVVAS